MTLRSTGVVCVESLGWLWKALYRRAKGCHGYIYMTFARDDGGIAAIQNWVARNKGRVMGGTARAATITGAGPGADYSAPSISQGQY